MRKSAPAAGSVKWQEDFGNPWQLQIQSFEPQHKRMCLCTDILYKDIDSTVQENQVCQQQEGPPTGCPSTEGGLNDAVFTQRDAPQKCTSELLVPGEGLSQT